MTAGAAHRRATAYATAASEATVNRCIGGGPGPGACNVAPRGGSEVTVTRSTTRRAAAVTAALAAAVLVTACGDQSSGQAAGGPGPTSGHFPVRVTTATFPATQRLAQPTRLTIAVRNTGHHALPDVAVSICNVTCAAGAPRGQGTGAQPFGHAIAASPNTANPSRPLWVLDRGPGRCVLNCASGGAQSGAGVTSDANTWALGRLAPGRTARFEWSVTAAQAGHHVVAWQVAGDLTGRAKATTAGGGTPHGRFLVTVATAPARTRVKPDGQVVTTN